MARTTTDSIMKYNLDFYTQYHQFYITSDNGNASASMSPDNDSAYEDRLTQTKNQLTVRTESYGQIKGEIVLLDSMNTGIDFADYDHIVESGIEVESGCLQILDCPNSQVELEIKVSPGTYKVRVYTQNLVNYNEEKENDYCKIEIWPDKNLKSKVLKRFVKE